MAVRISLSRRLMLPQADADVTGLPGYNVFSNMYLSGGALVPVSADDEAAEDIPKGRSVLSGSQRPGSVPGDERWAPIVGDKLARAQLGKRAVRLPGVTVSIPSASLGRQVLTGKSTSSTILQERVGYRGRCPQLLTHTAGYLGKTLWERNYPGHPLNSH